MSEEEVYINTRDLDEPRFEERKRKHIDTGGDSDDDLQHPLQFRSKHHDGGDLMLDDSGRKRQILENKMELLLKKPKVRRTRQDEDDLEQYLDEKILRLKDEMNIAAQRDIETLNKRIETNNEKFVAMEKVKLLPKILSTLSKVNLSDTILDNNLLQSVRIWLEPLPDGSLPAYEIQKSILNALENLPIKTEHLKESGLGKVIIFYTKSKRVEPKLARLADKLVAEWTRPIIGASDNYRDKRVMKLDFDLEKHRKKSMLDSAKSKKRKKLNLEEEHKSSYEQAVSRRNRASAPPQTTTDYKYAPISNIDAIHTSARSSGVGSSLNTSELYKRLSSRLTKPRKTK